ncbi:unnamed protein product [Paramecium pentaurelia]|uniref:Uncharacterized protein n=1 Tax=Paramecium pentaurelia TaxID=43138 RepID=A0A8S1XTS5_9CILI|nr:unnamed protein product [Paramecium pentaurelia]
MIKCQNFHYSCGMCGGMEELDCIICVDTDYIYLVGNTFFCKEGYYDAGLPVCQRFYKQSESCNFYPDTEKQKCIRLNIQSTKISMSNFNTVRQFVSGLNKFKCLQKQQDDRQNQVFRLLYYQSLKNAIIKVSYEMQQRLNVNYVQFHKQNIQ